MSLAFLVPLFLAGLAALAVPVVLHLRHRESDQPLRFPSLMFLERLSFRTARRQRISDWPLLLLRAAALALLAAAFARPFLAGEAATLSGSSDRAVVLLLDRSLSMSHRDVWPRALDSARRVIAELGAGDRVAVVLFDEDAVVAQPLTPDHAAARAALAAASPTNRGTRFAAAFRAARQLLLDAPGLPGALVVVTDLQRSGVGGLAGLDLPAGVTVRAVPVGTERRANAAVAAADVERRSDGPRTQLSTQARLVTRELAEPRRARITLTLNGRPSGTRDVTLPPSGSLIVAFDPVTPPAGLIRGVIQLEADALPGDDVFRFVLAADDAVRVLLVAPSDRRAEETLFFERALAIGRNPSVRVERRGLASLAQSGAGVVVLWDVPPPGGAADDALAAWIRQGGGVVIVAGGRLAAAQTSSALLPALLRGTSDRLADRGGTFGEVSLEHPLFVPFRYAPGALQSARFLRYPRLEPAVGADVLARYDDGLPAVVERRVGAGRVILIGVPLDARAGDFPLQPAYLPFLRRLVLHVSGHEASPLWRTTGEHWVVQSAVRQPVVAAPSGDILRPRADSGGAVVAVTDVGFYALHDARVGGDPVAVLAVNPPPGESDLTPVDPRELLLGVGQSDSSTAAAAGPATPVQAERAQSVWRILLLCMAVVLLAETVLANRGWRALGGPRSTS